MTPGEEENSLSFVFLGLFNALSLKVETFYYQNILASKNIMRIVFMLQSRVEVRIPSGDQLTLSSNCSKE